MSAEGSHHLCYVLLCALIFTAKIYPHLQIEEEISACKCDYDKTNVKKTQRLHICTPVPFALLF